MTLETFFEQFELLADAPNGVQKLRELILQLAIQGKLGTQDIDDEPAAILLEKIKAYREDLAEKKLIRKIKPLPSIGSNDSLFEIPELWKWVRLGELGDWGSGSTPDRRNSDYYNGSIPWLKSGELNDGYVKDSEEKVTELALKECSLRLNKPGDILIAMYGATIGRLAILEAIATTNQAVCACTCFEGFNNRYLFLLLKAYKNYFTKQGAGAAQPNISREKIIHTVVPLPPLEEQKRIVDKVDRLMAMCDRLEEQQKKRRESCIRLNEGAIAQLLSASNAEESDRHWQRICNNFDLFYSLPENISKLRKAIIQSASLGKLIQQSASDEPASSLLKKIKLEKEQLAKDKRVRKEEIFAPVDSGELITNLPSGWAGVRLGEVINCLDYLRKPINKEERQVRQGDIPYYGANGQVGWIDDFLFNEDLVLVVEDETFIGRQLPFCYRITGKSWVNNHAHVLQPTSGINVDFLNYSLSYYPFDTLTSGTTGRKKLTKSTLLNIPYMLPPLEEQKRIVTRVNGLLKLCDELEAKLKDSYSHQEKLMEVAAVQLMQATAKTPVFC